MVLWRCLQTWAMADQGKWSLADGHGPYAAGARTGPDLARHVPWLPQRTDVVKVVADPGAPLHAERETEGAAALRGQPLSHKMPGPASASWGSVATW